MDIINELVTILEHHQVRNIPVLEGNSNGDGTNKFLELFRFIQQNQLVDAENLAALLGTQPDAPNLVKSVKDLKKRLRNSLLFIEINQSEVQDSERIRYLCWQRLAVIKFLSSLNGNRTMSQMGIQLLQVGIEHEITSLNISIGMHLRQYFAVHVGDEKQFQHYANFVSQELKKLELEAKATNEVQTFVMMTQNPGFNHQDLVAFVGSKNQQIRCTEQENMTNVLSFCLAFFKLQEAILNEKWNSAYRIALCEITRLAAHKATLQQMKVFFENQAALVSFNQRKYEEGTVLIKKNLNLFMPGSFLWFSQHSFLVEQLLHQGQLESAWAIFKTFQNLEGTVILPDKLKLKWNIFKLYFLLSTDLKCLNLSPREKGELQKIKQLSYFHDLPIEEIQWITEEISVLIFQLINCFRQGFFDRMNTRIDLIEQKINDLNDLYLLNRVGLLLAQLKAIQSKQHNCVEILTREWSAHDLNFSHRFTSLEVIPFSMLINAVYKNQLGQEAKDIGLNKNSKRNAQIQTNLQTWFHATTTETKSI